MSGVHPAFGAWRRNHRIFSCYLRGIPYGEIAKQHNLSLPAVHAIIRATSHNLWVAWAKWLRAQGQCRRLAMELRMLKLGLEPPEDRPIETLNPPDNVLAGWKRAGVHTVNQLRSIDPITVVSSTGMRTIYMRWAILALDELGLSHLLRLPRSFNKSRKAQKLLGMQALPYDKLDTIRGQRYDRPGRPRKRDGAGA